MMFVLIGIIRIYYVNDKFINGIESGPSRIE